ncbi:MAG: hypothetical protein ACRC5H_03785 [Treponemataceae bacterium]
MGKIKIKGYHPSYFENFRDLFTSASIHYKQKEYIDCIKDSIYGSFISAVNLAFHGSDEELLEQDRPKTGKSHLFLSFKNLDKVSLIDTFNKLESELHKSVYSDLQEISRLVRENYKSFIKMPTFDKVSLMSNLKDKYVGLDNLCLQEQVYIFETDYLHKQFDRFLSKKDFNDWWETQALKLLQ